MHEPDETDDDSPAVHHQHHHHHGSQNSNNNKNKIDNHLSSGSNDGGYVSSLRSAAGTTSGGRGGSSSGTTNGNNGKAANRMLILSSSELQLNLLEKDNKSQVDGKIVAKREIKSENRQTSHSTRNNSNPQIAFNVNNNRGVNKNLNPYAVVGVNATNETTALTNQSRSTTSSDNVPAAIMVEADEVDVVDTDSYDGNSYDSGLVPDGVIAIATSPLLMQQSQNQYQMQQRQRLKQQQKQQSTSLHKIPNEAATIPVKYSHIRSAPSTSIELDTATGYETRQSASTMELECLAGYDGGLPQQFVLEAYDSRTKKLRLNVTSAYTDIPLFRFDLSGKLTHFWFSKGLVEFSFQQMPTATYTQTDSD